MASPKSRDAASIHYNGEWVLRDIEEAMSLAITY